MPNLRLPKRVEQERSAKESRDCPAHRAWVGRHHGSVAGCDRLPIECAHVRIGTDGGIGLKPSDRWVMSLCQHHHAEQHRIGERAFEGKYQIDLVELASMFAKRHRTGRGCESLSGHSTREAR